MLARTHIIRCTYCSFRCRCFLLLLQVKIQWPDKSYKKTWEIFLDRSIFIQLVYHWNGNLITITIGKYQHIVIFEFLYPTLVMFGQKFSFNLWLFPSFLRLFWLVKSPPAHLVWLFPPHITAVSQALQISLASLLLVVHPLQTHLWGTGKSKFKRISWSIALLTWSSVDFFMHGSIFPLLW